jgi:hypothetical protein
MAACEKTIVKYRLPSFGHAVALLASGVIGARNQPTVGEKLAVTQEAVDAIHLEHNRERADPADPGHPQQMLHVVVEDELRRQLALQPLDLTLEELLQFLEAARLDLRERG